jgi:hypothetical protein
MRSCRSFLNFQAASLLFAWGDGYLLHRAYGGHALYIVVHVWKDGDAVG